MKYLVASFNIETAPDLMEAARDLLAERTAELRGLRIFRGSAGCCHK